MNKKKTIFICQNCGAQSTKWLGKCLECGEWNTFVETKLETKKPSLTTFSPPVSLKEISSQFKKRISTQNEEVDRVLGGGLVPGSLILIAGEPGIGKSTLLLQLADKLGGLYVSGEESLSQIKIRAERLGIKGEKLLFLAETEIEGVVSAIEKQKEGIVVIDSIQTLKSEAFPGYPGSVAQVRECTNRLLKIGKKIDIPIFLVGHITKEGVVAGPKVLEHLVDTVLYLEGERFGNFRLLKAIKNRFGPTDEVGILEMTTEGLKEVVNPSEIFLSETQEKTPGSVVFATIEGTRCLLVEIQSLVVASQLAIPRRVGQGVDYNRLQMVLAVLTKILKLPLGGFDVYVNVTGGLKIEEPAADLGIALAVYSSFKNFPLPAKTVVWGELGLLGELRKVSQEEKRKKEALRLGFKNVISPQKFSSLKEIIHTLR
ncbi:MAG: DNA repair protein RadA [Microgenomates group bacterium]